MQLRTNDREGLSFLALQTGGRAVFNRNRFTGELDDISRDTSNYYSLAYVPPHGGDRAEHRIKVVVDRPKVEVRHRRGYRDKGPDERMSERLESALFLGMTANPLDARLAAGELRESGKGAYAMTLHVRVPASSVVFLPLDGGHLARLQVQVVARTGENRIVGFEQKRYAVQRPPGEGDVLDLVVDLELGEGAPRGRRGCAGRGEPGDLVRDDEPGGCSQVELDVSRLTAPETRRIVFRS